MKTPCTATSWRCGIPAASTTSASKRNPAATGWIVRFVVTERRVVRSIKYEGNKSVTVSEILDRFKERKVGLSVESQYDPNKVQRAAVVLKEFLSERGRQFATVDPQIRQIPPSSLEVTFNVNEGPEGEGRRRSTSTGQPRFQRPGGHPGDEEPAAHRHSALHPLREHLRQDLRLHQAGRGQGAHPRVLPGARLLHGARRSTTR